MSAKHRKNEKRIHCFLRPSEGGTGKDPKELLLQRGKEEDEVEEGRIKISGRKGEQGSDLTQFYLSLFVTTKKKKSTHFRNPLKRWQPPLLMLQLLPIYYANYFDLKKYEGNFSHPKCYCYCSMKTDKTTVFEKKSLSCPLEPFVFLNFQNLLCMSLSKPTAVIHSQGFRRLPHPRVP